MFDCVLPTRTARTGSALTATGRLNLRNARFARDPRPLDEGCGCPACTRFSRAYVRHLVNQQEMLGLRLLSLHNLWLFTRLTAGAREAIGRGDLRRVPRPQALARLAGGPQEDPCPILIIVVLFGLICVPHDPAAAREGAGSSSRCSRAVERRRRDPHRRRHLRDRPGARATRTEETSSSRSPRASTCASPQGARDGGQARRRAMTTRTTMTATTTTRPTERPSRRRGRAAVGVEEVNDEVETVNPDAAEPTATPSAASLPPHPVT